MTEMWKGEVEGLPSLLFFTARRHNTPATPVVRAF
jgi:hypothetical protein